MFAYRKKRCDVCSAKFVLDKSIAYTVEFEVGAFAALSNGRSYFDAVDCPKCGCQIILKQRERHKVDREGGSSNGL